MPPVRPKIVVTSAATLKRYGMTPSEWRALLRAQGDKCPICGRFPLSGRFVVDHEHVKGWRRMPPAKRREFVRGIVCFLCNGKCLSKWTTRQRAEAVVRYLKKYERTQRGK